MKFTLLDDVFLVPLLPRTLFSDITKFDTFVGFARKDKSACSQEFL